MRDFEDEIPGYLRNEALVYLLASLSLKPGRPEIGNNLYRCYSTLIQQGFLPQDELSLLRAWLDDIEEFGSQRTTSQNGSVD